MYLKNIEKREKFSNKDIKYLSYYEYRKMALRFIKSLCYYKWMHKNEDLLSEIMYNIMLADHNYSADMNGKCSLSSLRYKYAFCVVTHFCKRTRSSKWEWIARFTDISKDFHRYSSNHSDNIALHDKKIKNSLEIMENEETYKTVLNILSKKELDIFISRVIECKKYKDIGKEVGYQEGTTRVLFSEIVKKIKVALKLDI